MYFGGGSGIRTHDTVSRIHAFQASAFSHSAIPPRVDSSWRRAHVFASQQSGLGAIKLSGRQTIIMHIYVLFS